MKDVSAYGHYVSSTLAPFMVHNIPKVDMEPVEDL